MKLKIDNLNFSYGKVPILKDVSFETEGGITSILGPNGAGKSTLVKCLAGINKPSKGTATFDGYDLIHRNPDEINLAYMSQENARISNMSVLEVMLLGRATKLKIKVTDEDLEAAYKPLRDLHLDHLAMKQYNELSGGQCQMIMIAQCLVSEPNIIILDEPMNNLDLRKELEMFDIMKKLTREREMTTLMVLHDVNFAAKYSDKVVIMQEGELYGIGTPEEMITEDSLRDVYGVEARVGKDSLGNPLVEPLHSIYAKRLGIGEE